MPRKSHRRRIYEDYLRRIQHGEISADDRLVDTAIAAELGVSRMPVRDALMQLAHEGYLEGTSRGFTLPSLSHRQIMEFFELRRLLEPQAAASAAQVLDDASLALMRQAVDDSASTLVSDDIGLFFRASEIFRNTWLASVPNRELRQVIQRYLGQVQKVRMTTMRDAVSHRVVVEGQQGLMDAFMRHDALAAADRMLRFVIMAETKYLELKPATD